MVWCIACRSAAVIDPARPAGPSSVQVGVELADHRVGQGLAEFVLVGFVADPVPVGRAERVGHLGHQPAGPAVLDDLAELVEQQVAVRRRVQGAVGAPLLGRWRR